MRRRLLLRIIWSAAIVLSLLWTWAPASRVEAQQAGSWSDPIVLSGDREALFPAIAADDSGQVHALWIERGDKEFTGWGDGLTYARLTNGAWSEPLDVLRNPTAWDFSVSPPALVVAGDRVHALWSSSNGLFYSSTAIGAPISARSWSQPVRLAEGGGSPFVVADSQGALHAASLDAVSANPGIDYLRSIDNGLTWSQPQRLSPPALEAGPVGAQAYSTYMHVDKDDRLHLAWTDPFDGGTFYMFSMDGGDTWSTPIPVDAEPSESTNGGVWPSIGEDGDGNLLLMWQGVHGEYETCARYQRVSTDHGITWSLRERKFFDEFQGCLGWNMMQLDSSGRLHVLMIGRRPDGAHRLYFNTWQDMQWSRPVWIAGVETPTSVNWDVEGIDQPQFAITEGNRLHGVWVTRDRRVWYTSRTIDAPHVPPQPVPTPDAVDVVAFSDSAADQDEPAINTVQNSTVMESSPSPTLALENAAPASSEPWMPVVVGVLPAFVLVLFVVLSIGRRRIRMNG